MISAMTTSENFPLSSQSGCPRSAYDSAIQPSYFGGQPGREDDGRRLGPERLPSPLRYCREPEETDLLTEETDFFSKEVPRSKLETELSELLDQLETEDSSPFDQSKPLKIDPNVLKLDFSKLSSQVKKDCSFDKLCLTDLFEMKRTSHHLSGGGLLTNAPPANDSFNSKLCRLSGVGLIPSDNVFSFENMVEVGQFLNQISPSSPLSFDLTAQKQGNPVPNGSSENTNPFKNLPRTEESPFPATNPFTDCNSSSLDPSIILTPSRYENISLPHKSFSQCSTRPASPALNPPEEPLLSNPFLINDTSPDPAPSPPTKPPHSLPNTSSFILAVPVFPIFQHSITNSSTQTTDSPDAEDPVYQNVSSQLTKFMKRNDHSEYDFHCLKSTMKDLRTSGWYYENVRWQESLALLADTEPGTFLIRDSSDPNFLFSLSVQTSRGPTSVRIHYVNGQFRLDAEKKLIPHMPSFNSVIELIDYYVENTVKNRPNGRSAKKASRHKLQKSKDQVWIDAQGNIYSNILLAKPLYKRDHFSSLQHLARLVINKLIRKRLNAKVKFNFRVTPVYESSPFQDSSFQNNFDNFCPILNIDALPLPSKLLQYLKEYPYCH